MIKRKIYIISFFLFSCLCVVFAQNNVTAEKLLKSSLDKLKKSTYQSSFSLIYYNAESEHDNMQVGKCTMQGRRFRIELSDIESIYDGKTQWIFIATDNEVSITEPSEAELRESNPIVMMESYMMSHRINYAESKEKDYEVVNLFPVNNIKTQEYFKITIKINKATLLPKQLIIYQRNGDRISFRWDSIRAVSVPSSFFSFVQKDYPNVVVNDMR